jgi:hypothetical protein
MNTVVSRLPLALTRSTTAAASGLANAASIRMASW